MPRPAKRKRVSRSSSANSITAEEALNDTTGPEAINSQWNDDLGSASASVPSSRSPNTQESRKEDNKDDDLDPILLDDELFEVPLKPSPVAPHQKRPRNVGVSRAYNEPKYFQGQRYSGMSVGGSHTWNYDSGVWCETKEEPDLWHIDYTATKRRARNAPTGSGAPVGTEYHWLVIAHQYVRKEDANTYTTHLFGSKYKLAHKNAGSGSWSVPTVKAQRDRELWLLDDAKRRVQGLPPVISGEKAKVAWRDKGQRTIDSMFGGNKTAGASKRRADDDEGREE